MKNVQLPPDGDRFKAYTVLHDVAASNPKGGDPAQMRKRVRILDALSIAEKDGNREFQLEDADWEELKSALNSYPWGVNDSTLLAIIDAVMDAKKVVPPTVKKKE